LYIVFCVWTHHDDIRKTGVFSTQAALEVAGDVALLVAACTYWLPALRSIPAALLSALYLCGCVGSLAPAVSAARRHIKDPELPCQGKVFVAVTGSALGAAITAPLLYWGWLAAIRFEYAAA
jgi:hypothetical protein